MKIAYQDLLNFFSEKPSKEVLSEKLFQLGHVHEINGNLIEIDITPNRGDCLSLTGIARDLAIFFGKSINIEIFDEEFDELEFSLINNSIDDCPKISFVEIEINEVLSQYKPYMDAYFSVLGNKKTNFFTDISNYLSYELGNPTHCFDSQKIEKLFVFESVNCDENFKTLQNSEIKLNGINSVFKMNDEIISLAGVMGGESTACSVNTKKL